MEMKLKPQYDTTTYLLELLKLKKKKKKLTLPSVGKDVDQLEFLDTVHGNLKWYNHFEKQFFSFLKS